MECTLGHRNNFVENLVQGFFTRGSGMDYVPTS